ncbi:MAG: T9SS type A sorting domain-containing protein [candidate division WOR-3 bacterium]
MISIKLFIIAISLKPVFYTNHNYVYNIAVNASSVYAATNGGIVAYNYLNNNFKVLTNTDGLTTNRQKCIAIDSSGNIWAGSDNGLVQIDKSFNNIQIYPIECLPCTRVNTIYCLKDTILVGTQNGLLVIDTKGTSENFQDDKVLKIYDFQGLSSNNVLTIEVDTFFWIGTDEKITRFTNDFQNYTIYGMENGLLKNYIVKIKIIDSGLYVGTDGGLNRFTGTHFDTLITGYKIVDIEKAGDSLLLALDSLRQIGIFFQGNLSLLNSGIPYLIRINDIENYKGIWFCATGNSFKSDYFGEGIGIYNFVNQQWELKKDNCLASNHICSITANRHGVFIAHGTRNVDARGVSWLKTNQTWQNLCQDSLVPTKFVHRCITAPDKKIWFALHYTDSLIAISYDPENNSWYYLKQKYRGIDSTVAIWDLKFDLRNNMYLSLAGPSDKIWVFDSALTVAYLLGDRTPGFEVELAIDSSLHVYSTVFDAAGGVLMIDTKGTIFDRGDDINLKYGKTDGLLSQFCSGITVDERNNVYIANEIGVSVLQNNRFEYIENFNGGMIYDVLADGEGRVWIMADNGIYAYDINYKILKGFLFNELSVNVEFLPVSNEIIQVQGFFYDSLRSCFWLGSENGLLKLEICKSDTSLLDSVIIYPNPVIRGGVVRIKNIPDDATVTIFSISGRKLAQGLNPNSLGEVLWQIPSNIPSGLYFALIITGNDKKVCKFAIVK